MGRSTLLIVLGYIMIFGMIQGDMFEITERASANTAELYEDLQLRHLMSCAMEYLVSLNVQSGTTDTTVTISSWVGGNFSGNMSLQGSDGTLDTLDVTVIGQFATRIDTVTAEFESQSPSTALPFPTITAALAFYSPTASLTLNAWAGVDGNDVNMDGSPGSCTALPGVSKTGTISTTMKSHSSITGAPPSPTPATVAGTWEELQSMADAYAANADIVIPAGSVIAGATYGGAANPVIVLCEGNVKYTAWSEGYGILIVRGDFDCTAHFAWYGLVLISNSISNSFSDNAHSLIQGALLMGAPNSTANIKAQTAIQYSCEALDMVINNLTTGGGSTTVEGPRQITRIDWWE